MPGASTSHPAYPFYRQVVDGLGGYMDAGPGNSGIEEGRVTESGLLFAEAVSDGSRARFLRCS